mmetsp:Transcript_34988/g.88055  ORF Transcript_34988/g.88055 Transcript_34988/m.88055 type:complete len:207 (+) Transcript_34988:296-916(+)
MLWSSANNSSRRLPKQKCSMILYISSGFSALPPGGSSAMIMSVSTFAWIKWPSWLRLTCPLMPIRQCSFVWCRTVSSSRLENGSDNLSASLFVFSHTMSSQRRNPHRRSSSRPWSSPSQEPTHRKTNDCASVTSSMRRSIISSNVQAALWLLPPMMLDERRWYSCQGGSTSTTSNFMPRSARLYVLRSHLRYMGGEARCLISSSFK